METVRMRSSSFFYFPLALPMIACFGLLLFILLTLFQLNLIRYGYERAGISSHYTFLLLIFSLLGSGVNIPLFRLTSEPTLSDDEVSFFGIRHVIPAVQRWPGTVVAVNLGGAIIPTIVSLYLVTRTGLWQNAIVATAAVAVVVHFFAIPIQGIGIAVPWLIPAVAASAVSLFVPRDSAPTLAYIAGSIGTLIGADILNLHRLRGLGAPILSIGGAGCFDGIFISGILAALLA